MSREAIFAKLHHALVSAPETRAAPVPHPIPAIGRTPPAQQVAQCQAALEKRGAEVRRVARPQSIPETVRELIDSAKLPRALRMGRDPLIADLDWTGIEVSVGAAEEGDRASLSRATAGIAETGTVMLTSGADNPATLAFLPELHIVVLEALSLKANMEDALAMLTGSDGPECLPRSINFISGPSCTADIGGRLVYGAHGPKRLIVILVEEEAAGTRAV